MHKSLNSTFDLRDYDKCDYETQLKIIEYLEIYFGKILAFKEGAKEISLKTVFLKKHCIFCDDSKHDLWHYLTTKDREYVKNKLIGMKINPESITYETRLPKYR